MKIVMDFISELQKKDNKIIVKLTSALTGKLVKKQGITWAYHWARQVISAY